MIILAAGSRYGESPESDEELSLLGDTIVREALNHAAETRDIDNVRLFALASKLNFSIYSIKNPV
jgi:hypothetical protein